VKQRSLSGQTDESKVELPAKMNGDEPIDSGVARGVVSVGAVRVWCYSDQQSGELGQEGRLGDEGIESSGNNQWKKLG
jgi:hypothetical protein